MNSKWRIGEEFIQPAMKPIYERYKPLADRLVESNARHDHPRGRLLHPQSRTTRHPLPVKTYKLLPHGIALLPADA